MEIIVQDKHCNMKISLCALGLMLPEGLNVLKTTGKYNYFLFVD